MEGTSRSAVTGATAALTFLRREPIIPIFILAGVFQILSGDPLSHALFLFGAALVLVWDRTRSEPAPRASTRAGSPFAAVPPWAVGAAIVSYAWIAGSFARFTWPITVAVLVPGAAAIVVAWRQPVRTEPAAVDRLGVVLWVGVFLALGLWELTQLLLQPALLVNSYAHPTLSYLTDPLLNHHHLDRSLLLAAWLFLGVDLIRR